MRITLVSRAKECFLNTYTMTMIMFQVHVVSAILLGGHPSLYRFVSFHWNSVFCSYSRTRFLRKYDILTLWKDKVFFGNTEVTNLNIVSFSPKKSVC